MSAYLEYILFALALLVGIPVMIVIMFIITTQMLHIAKYLGLL